MSKIWSPKIQNIPFWPTLKKSWQRPCPLCDRCRHCVTNYCNFGFYFPSLATLLAMAISLLNIRVGNQRTDRAEVVRTDETGLIDRGGTDWSKRTNRTDVVWSEETGTDQIFVRGYLLNQCTFYFYILYIEPCCLRYVSFVNNNVVNCELSEYSHLSLTASAFVWCVSSRCRQCFPLILSINIQWALL